MICAGGHAGCFQLVAIVSKAAVIVTVPGGYMLSSPSVYT